MKKQFSILLLLCLLCLTAAGCSKSAVPSNDAQGNSAENSTVGEGNTKNTIDVDLAGLSSTMIYAEVYNIMTNPSDYMGKTIRMYGPYSAVYLEETKKYYHYVIIEDAAACCTQGLEFVWNGKHVYPDDYPKEQSVIEVVGVFGSYVELGQTYYCIEVDRIAVLK